MRQQLPLLFSCVAALALATASCSSDDTSQPAEQLADAAITSDSAEEQDSASEQDATVQDDAAQDDVQEAATEDDALAQDDAAPDAQDDDATATVPKCKNEVDLSTQQLPCSCYGTVVNDVAEAMPDCELTVVCCPSVPGLKCE